MKKGDKIFLSVAGVIVLLVILFLLRYYEVFPMGYESVGLEGDYVQVQCQKYGKDIAKTLTEKEEIEECVSKVNEFQVREADWFDRMLGRDGEPEKGMLGGCEKLVLLFKDSEGNETAVSFPLRISKGGDMAYIRGLFSAEK